MKIFDLKVFAASLVALMWTSCSVLHTTSSTTYSDDVYGVYTPKPQTVEKSTAQQPKQDDDVTVYDSQADNNSRLYSNPDETEEVIVDDSYTTRIYRFHRPCYTSSYYDVVVCEPWYRNWYWDFGWSYNSFYWHTGWGMPYRYSYWGDPYWGYSWYGYHHRYYDPCFHEGYYRHYGYGRSSFDRHYAMEYNRIHRNANSSRYAYGHRSYNGSL